jgi:phosphate/sulfate permease
VAIDSSPSQVFAWGMMCSMCSVFIILTTATYLGLGVSTTHTAGECCLLVSTTSQVFDLVEAWICWLCCLGGCL